MKSFILLDYYIWFVILSNALVGFGDVLDDMLTMTTDELIRFYGYKVETHTVTTEDGYILTVFHCQSKKSTPHKNKVVLVQHGLELSSDDFCINPPVQGLAYVFADAGYDVWLPNSRGNFYSRHHVSKDPDDHKSDFWNFSWYELGIYDNPAVIDYILQQTSNDKLYYVGHSQGTTTLLTLLSEKPEYNDKIHAASLMSPIAYITQLTPFHAFLIYFFSPVYKIFFNIAEFWPRNSGIAWLTNNLIMEYLGISVDTLLMTAQSSQVNSTMQAIFNAHVPSGASTKQFYHYADEAKYRYFGKYDEDGRTPSDFPLSQISVPISLHHSPNDGWTVPVDIDILIDKLSHTVGLVQRIDKPKFTHMDFVWGMNSATIVYSKILKFFENHR